MSIADNFRDIVRHYIAPTRYYGFYPYEVTGFSGTDPRTRRPDLTPVEPSDGLPALPAVDRIPGFTGAAESFVAKTPTTPGTIVLVGFRGGNPGRPFVAFTLPTVPTAIDVYLTFGDGAFTIHEEATSSEIPATGPEPVAIARKVVEYFNTLGTYLTAVQAAIVAIDPVQGTALGTARAAYEAARAALDVPYPVGIRAKKLKTV